MTEREACALLKRRFEDAGYRIDENQPFDEGGVLFEIDGYDRDRRVGYEYVTAEAGDSWDVDGAVIANLEARRARGELHILIINEQDAPDAQLLDQAARAFLAELPTPTTPAATTPAPTTPAATTPAATTPAPTTPAPTTPAPTTPAATTPAATTPAATKPAATKPAATKPAATKPATKPAATKPAATKPAATKPATKPAATKPAATKPAAKSTPGTRRTK